MALILCIETTTTNCSVALSKNGKTLVLIEDNSKNYSHAERLHTSIEAALKKGKVTLNDLNAIAVSKGPGSYTGLRIGVSAAKGLCFSLDIPLISIPTLQSLALQVQQPDGVIVPMIDARRMEVYTAVFDADNHCISPVEAKILDTDSYQNFLKNGKVYFIGNGVAKWESLCSHPNAVFMENHLPSANEMGALAHTKFEQSDFENTAYFEPYYLKDFVAGK